MEKDTTSMITTGARSSPVFDDNEDYAGSVQVFGGDRKTESAAIDAILNPRRNEDMSADELIEYMRRQGYEQCARCGHFKEFKAFSEAPANTGRSQCHSYCKQCVAERHNRKHVALLPPEVRAQQRYEYRAYKFSRRK